jgi:malate dehydrogenase
VSGWPPARVFGESGSLDAARFRTFVAEALGVASRDVVGFVLGTHGDTMVPILSLTSVAGVPLARLLPADRLTAIVERTKKGGGEIVELLKMGSAYYAPSAVQAELVRAVALDEKRILPVTAHLSGQFGLRDLYLGVPARIGRGGVEAVLDVELNDAERHSLEASARAVREDMQILAKLPR